ncbi:MAG TPA: oligopeptide/dipeptide ABC transporter ATP-binding protein, partial [Nocardioidaceae bacterium]|nr:oligopeptide/dipeptide ABC transporter ATP-binding protein [Nocardioidaceae bacterium]
LQRDFGSAIVFITHDLGVIAEIADDVLVMYGGRAVELGTCNAVMSKPQMPYTWGLLESIPELDTDPTQRLLPIPGTPPSLLHPPTGCPFHPRCQFTGHVPGNLCERELPELIPAVDGAGHLRRCHLRNAHEVLTNAAEKREV